MKNLHLENRESECRLIAKIVTIGLRGTDFGGYFWMEWDEKVSKIGFDISCVERHGYIAMMLYLIGSPLQKCVVKP